jgi:primary-amine oxidase
MYWTFGQDGSIGFEVKATGELSTNLTTEPENPYGTLVADGINAQFHQHLFAMRLDTMFDGIKNSVSTLDIVPLQGEFGSKDNPYGQGFKVEEKLCRTTNEGKLDTCAETSRVWKISNAGSINPITQKPVGFKLIPMNGQKLMAKAGSFIAKRAGFAAHSLWVTPFNEEERFPGGFYVNQSKGGDGLPEWTKKDKKVEDEDIVLWHVFGVTHIPRVEDFPIMSVEPCGFILKPCNFFTANPALDVPAPTVVAKVKQSACHMKT